MIPLHLSHNQKTAFHEELYAEGGNRYKEHNIQINVESVLNSCLFRWCERFLEEIHMLIYLLLHANCVSYLTFPVVRKGQVVVGASILLIVVDVGVEIGEVAVQVHSICIVPANQIPRNVWTLVGKWRNENKGFRLNPIFEDHCIILFKH